MIEVIETKLGKFYFRVKAENGEILCHSEQYESKQGCVKGLEAMLQEARRETLNIKHVKL